jgi:hypothetical protein
VANACAGLTLVSAREETRDDDVALLTQFGSSSVAARHLELPEDQPAVEARRQSVATAAGM